MEKWANMPERVVRMINRNDPDYELIAVEYLKLKLQDVISFEEYWMIWKSKKSIKNNQDVHVDT
jgi:hypothetical protein